MSDTIFNSEPFPPSTFPFPSYTVLIKAGCKITCVYIYLSSLQIHTYCGIFNWPLKWLSNVPHHFFMLSIFSIFLADKPSSHLSQSLLLHSGLSHIYWSLPSISKEKLVSTSLKLSCTLERALFSTLNLSLTLKVADIYTAIYIPQSASLHYLIQSSDQSNEALKRRKVRLLVIHTLQWPRAEVPACAQPFPHPPLLYYLNLGSDFMIHQAVLGSSASHCPTCLKARDNLRHNCGWLTQHNCHS